MNTHIYALHDPRDWSIRYVGKADDLNRRKRTHLCERKPRAFQEWLSELKASGLSFAMTILQVCPKDQWPIWEKFWIATIKQSGECLLNSTEGGNGHRLVTIYSDHARARISAALRGRKPSAETREKLRKARLGKKQSAETAAKKRDAMKGRKPSANTIAALRRRRWSPEDRLKISQRMVGNQNGLGKKHPSRSQEFRERQRENAIKQYLIPGMHEKISAATRLAMRKMKEETNG